MKATMVLGGELDIATTDEVRDIVGSATDSILSKIPRGKRLPDRRRIPASAIAVAGTTTVLDFGGPQASHVWAVIDVVVTGADDRTAVAATTAAIYIGDPVTAMLGMLLRPAQAVPSFFSFAKEYPLHFGENLFMNVYGAGTGQVLSGVATIYQYLEGIVESSGT